MVLLVVSLVAILVAAGVIWVNARRPDDKQPPAPRALPTPTQVADPPARAPNIVLVVADDLSMDLLAAMRQDDVMAARGASYPHAFVDNSLCCVSRSSIFTGQYPHQTGVLTNSTAVGTTDKVGGWEAFVSGGNDPRSVNVRLQGAGYTTGFIGKYLNEYEPDAVTGALPPIPPGWSDFQALFGGAYDQWEYDSTVTKGGQVHLVPEQPAPALDSSNRVKDRAYAGNDISRRALAFIRRHRDDRRPYFLEVAPYGPHSAVGDVAPWSDVGHEEPFYPPEFRDRPRPGHPQGNCGPVGCDELTVRDLPGFGDDRSDNAPTYADGTPAPDWRINDVTVTAHSAEVDLRNRARMVQNIDRMLAKILRVVDDNTYVVFTSDNGLHLGQYGLQKGKGSPFDSDVHVPLLVVGPGVVPGERPEVVSNLDFAPTFEDLAGLRPAPYRSGTSLVPTFASPELDRRDVTFIESYRSSNATSDPDQVSPQDTLGIIPSYVAVRSRTALLVRLDLDSDWEGTDYVFEYYDLRQVSWERTNTFADPSHPRELHQMMRLLTEYDTCSAATGQDSLSHSCRHLTWR